MARVDRDHVAMVAARFSEDAPLYERFWAPSLAALGRRLLAGLPIHDASVVVDIGAGVGALLPAIREAAPRAFVAAVDVAEGMIHRAPRDFGRAVMDAGRLALRDASIDGAVMPFMLFFLPDPRRGLAEARRVLRPGGRLGVSTWAGGLNDYRADEIWLDLLDEYGAPPEQATPGVDLMDTPEAGRASQRCGLPRRPYRHRCGAGLNDPRRVPRGALPHRPIKVSAAVPSAGRSHRSAVRGEEAIGETPTRGLDRPRGSSLRLGLEAPITPTMLSRSVTGRRES